MATLAVTKEGSVGCSTCGRHTGGAFTGAKAIGTKVYFTPAQQGNVGIFDTSNNQLTQVPCTGISPVYWRFNGAGALVGTKLYFAPYSQDKIGVFDTATDQWDTTIQVSGLTCMMGSNCNGNNQNYFGGGAAIGCTVYFAPYCADQIGVLDTTTNTFSTMAVSWPASWWPTNGVNKFGGVSLFGANRLIMHPWYGNNVGVLTDCGGGPATATFANYPTPVWTGTTQKDPPSNGVVWRPPKRSTVPSRAQPQTLTCGPKSSPRRSQRRPKTAPRRVAS